MGSIRPELCHSAFYLELAQLKRAMANEVPENLTSDGWRRINVMIIRKDSFWSQSQCHWITYFTKVTVIAQMAKLVRNVATLRHNRAPE